MTMAREPIMPTLPHRGAAGWLDRLGMGLSALCLVHCIGTSVLIVTLASAGALASPWVHRIGLTLAVLIGAIALGRGYRRHRAAAVLARGIAGLMLMALALFLPHGLPEAGCTMAGVALLFTAHLHNIRHARDCRH